MSQGQRANRSGSSLFGVYRTAQVLKDGSTTEREPVTDLMTWRTTLRDARKVANEWNAMAKEAGSDSVYFAKRMG